MTRFSIDASDLKAMENKVIATVGVERARAFSDIDISHSLLCGCGAGGNCASSCVSGCADRG